VEIFEEKVEAYILNSIVGRVKEYLTEVEKLRPKHNSGPVDEELQSQNNPKRIVLR